MPATALVEPRSPAPTSAVAMNTYSHSRTTSFTDTRFAARRGVGTQGAADDRVASRVGRRFGAHHGWNRSGWTDQCGVSGWDSIASRRSRHTAVAAFG